MFNPKFSGANKWAGKGLGAVSSVVVTGMQKLFMVVGYNATAADRYLHVFDVVGTPFPANGAMPDLPPIRIPAHTDGSVDYGSSGRLFTSGVVVAVSTTETTLTLGGSDCFLDVGYRAG